MKTIRKQLTGLLLALLFISGDLVKAEQVDPQLLEKVLTGLKNAGATYTNRCSNNEWKKAGWSDELSCLQDGRIHLVYELDAKKAQPLNIFTKEDLSTLGNAALEGAQILVKENRGGNSGVLYECTATEIRTTKDKETSGVTCSSNDFNWVDVKSKQTARILKHHKIWFTTDTNATRFYQYSLFPTGIDVNNDIGSTSSYSWYVRY